MTDIGQEGYAAWSLSSVGCPQCPGLVAAVIAYVPSPLLLCQFSLIDAFPDGDGVEKDQL
jgi:hypothetical protein